MKKNKEEAEKKKKEEEEKKKKEEEDEKKKAKAEAEESKEKKVIEVIEKKSESKKEPKEEKKKDDLLDFAIEGGGGNLSSGEKALVCICRAILRKSKVVILDEATATVDLKTEQSIQRLIDLKFEGATMLVIAHRLQTIINSDKVLLIGAGKKREFGNPQKLIKTENSLFKKLVDKMQKSGQVENKENKDSNEK